MIAYKFLHSGGVGIFSGFAWPLPNDDEPGAWVASEGEPVRCSNGIHACDSDALVDWIDDELWMIELSGAITASEGVLVAPRGRLLQRVPEWDADTTRALGEGCVWRVRDLVAGALRAKGLGVEADKLETARDLDALQSRAVADLAGLDEEARSALAYVRDAVELNRGGRPDACRGDTIDAGPGAIAANLAFVSAVAAGSVRAARAGDPEVFGTAFAAERDWQRAWLSERLGIAA